MTPKEAFRFGFLARCVEEGLSSAQTQQIIKRAFALSDVAKFTWPLAAIPPTLGAAAAVLKNRALDTEDQGFTEDVQQQELAETYRRMSEQLRRQSQMRAYKKKRTRAGQIFL